MIERRWIEQLNSADVQSRKIAIQQLARSRDLEAIHYLETVRSGDADDSVRDLANKAIVFIQRANEAPEPQPSTPEVAPSPKEKFAATSIISEYANNPPPPKADGSPAVPSNEVPKLKRFPVTAQNERASKNAMTLAGRASFEELPGKAAKYLVEAFKLNPNLQFDNYAIGMAATITGLYKTDAVKAVLDGSILDLFEKHELTGKPKQAESKEAQTPPAGWGVAIVDLLIYGVVQALMVGVMVLVLLQIVVTTIQNNPEIQSEIGMSTMLYGDLANNIANIPIISVILYSIFYGLVAILMQLVVLFVVHIIARFMMGGDGTLPNLIHWVTPFISFTIVPLSLISCASLLLPVTARQPIILAIGGILSIILSIFILWGYVVRIGKAYDMGAAKGCLSFIIVTSIGIIISLVFRFLLQYA